MFEPALIVEAASVGFGSADLPLSANLILTANRVALGLALGLSGWNKTFVPGRHESLVNTLRDDARLPLADRLGWLVCLSELTVGTALVFGIAAGFAALVALALCCVATATVELRQLSVNFHPINRLDWIDDLFFIPADLFIIQALVILFVGVGYIPI